MTLFRRPNMQDSPKPDLLLSGIDSLYAGFFIDGLGIDWEEIETAKQEAVADRDRTRTIALGSETFVMEPRGAHPYRYRLANKAFRLRLSEHISPRCHAQFQSEALWLEGYEALTDRIRSWFRSIGCHEVRTATVSRLDWAFDFALDGIDFTIGDFVTRTVKDATWREHGAIQSFQLGKDAVVIRLYDKVAEIEQQSGKVWFFDLWGQQSGVWRVEVQVRRDRLRQAGIDSLGDIGDLSGDLLREVFTRHTRLCRPQSSINRSRWPNHPLWNSLLHAVEGMPQTGLIETIDRKNPIAYRTDRQVRAIYGHLKGFAANYAQMTGKPHPPTLDDTLMALLRMSERHHSDIAWQSDVEERMTRGRFGQ